MRSLLMLHPLAHRHGGLSDKWLCVYRETAQRLSRKQKLSLRINIIWANVTQTWHHCCQCKAFTHVYLLAKQLLLVRKLPFHGNHLKK